MNVLQLLVITAAQTKKVAMNATAHLDTLEMASLAQVVKYCYYTCCTWLTDHACV